MGRAHFRSRVVSPVAEYDSRPFVAPADADLLLTTMKHNGFKDHDYADIAQRLLTAHRHISCMEDDCGEFSGETSEPTSVDRQRSSVSESWATRRGNLAAFIGEPESDVDCSSGNSDYLDMEAEFSWGLEGEEQDDENFSSEKTDLISLPTGEDASFRSNVYHGEGCESGKGQHTSTHSEYRSFVCPVENCGRKYKRRGHLDSHSLTQCAGNLFECTWVCCSQTFNAHSNLQRHINLHGKWGADLLEESERADTCVACLEPGCGKSFKNESYLQMHTKNVHESLSITQAICMEPGCGAIFDSPQLLRLLTEAAHSFVYCETCGVSMLKKDLAAHTQKVHEGEQELMGCPFPGCLHSYSKKSNLDSHVRAIHMNMKPYACSYNGCEMRFAYRAERDEHEQSVEHFEYVLEGDFDMEDYGLGGLRPEDLETDSEFETEDLDTEDIKTNSDFGTEDVKTEYCDSG